MRYEEALCAFGLEEGFVLTPHELKDRYHELISKCNVSKCADGAARETARASLKNLQEAYRVLLESQGGAPAPGAASSGEARTALLRVQKRIKSEAPLVLASYLSWLAEENKQRQQKIADEKNAEAGKGKAKTETKATTRSTEEVELSQAERDIRHLKEGRFEHFVSVVTQNADVVRSIASLVSYQQKQIGVAVKLILDITISYIAFSFLWRIRRGKEVRSPKLTERTLLFLKSMSQPPALEGVLFDRTCPRYCAVVGQCLLSLLWQVIFGQRDGLYNPSSESDIIKFFAGAPSFILSGLQKAELTDQQREDIRKFISKKSVPAETLVAFYIALAVLDRPREVVFGELARSLSDEALLKSNWFCAVEASGQAVVRGAKKKKIDDKLVVEKSVDEILLLNRDGFTAYLNANRLARARLLAQGDGVEYSFQEYRHYQSMQSACYKWVVLKRDGITEREKDILLPYLLEVENRRHLSKQMLLLTTTYTLLAGLRASKLSPPPLNALEYGVAILMRRFSDQEYDFRRGTSEATNRDGSGVYFGTLLKNFISTYEVPLQLRFFEDGVQSSFFRPEQFPSIAPRNFSPQINQAVCCFNSLVPVLIIDGHNSSLVDAPPERAELKGSFAETLCSYLEMYVIRSEQRAPEADKIELQEDVGRFSREKKDMLAMLAEYQACRSELKKGSLHGRSAIKSWEEKVGKLLKQLELGRDKLARSPFAKLVLSIYYASPDPGRASNKDKGDYIFATCKSNSPQGEAGRIDLHRDWLTKNRQSVTKLLLTDEADPREEDYRRIDFPLADPELWKTFLLYLELLVLHVKTRENDLGEELRGAIALVDAEQQEKNESVEEELRGIYEKSRENWEAQRESLNRELVPLIEKQATLSQDIVSIEKRVAGLETRWLDKDFLGDQDSRKGIDKTISATGIGLNDLKDRLVKLRSDAPGTAFSGQFAKAIHASARKIGLGSPRLADLSDSSAWRELNQTGKIFGDTDPWSDMVRHSNALRSYKREIGALIEQVDDNIVELRNVRERMNFVDAFLENLRDKKKLEKEIKSRIASCKLSMVNCEPLLKFAEQAERSSDFPIFLQPVLSLKDDENRLDILAEQFEKILPGPTTEPEKPDYADSDVLDDFRECKTCLSEHAKRVDAIAKNLGRCFDADIQELTQAVADIEKRLGDKLSSDKILQATKELSAIETDVANLQARLGDLASEISFYGEKKLLVSDEERTTRLRGLQRVLRLFQHLSSTLAMRERLAELRARKTKVFAPTAETAVSEENSCLYAPLSHVTSDDITSDLETLAALEIDYLELFHRLISLRESVNTHPDDFKQKAVVQQFHAELDRILVEIQAIRNRKVFLKKELVKRTLRKLPDAELDDEAKKTVGLALKALDDKTTTFEPEASTSREDDAYVFRIKTRDCLYAITVLKISPDLERLFLDLEDVKFHTTWQSIFNLATKLREQLNALEKESKASLGEYGEELKELLTEIVDAQKSLDRYGVWSSRSEQPKNLEELAAYQQEGYELSNWLRSHAYRLRNMVADLQSGYGSLCTTHMKCFKVDAMISLLESVSPPPVTVVAPVVAMPVEYYYSAQPYGFPGFFVQPPVATTVPQLFLVSEQPPPTFGF